MFDVLQMVPTDGRVALTAVALRLVQLPFVTRYSSWRDMLHTIASRTRKDLLSDLDALKSIIIALGGDEAVGETARAVQDVGRWWS